MEVKPLLYWDNRCWSAGAEESAVMNRDQHHQDELFCGMFPRGQLRYAVVQKAPRLHYKLGAELGNVLRFFHMVLVLEAWKMQAGLMGLWRKAETHQEFLKRSC